MTRSIAGRIARLEEYRKPRPPYVLRSSTPRTAQEERAISLALTAGRRFAVVPHKAATAAEWQERYGNDRS